MSIYKSSWAFDPPSNFSKVAASASLSTRDSKLTFPPQDGVFDFLFTNNPDIDPEKAAIIDASTGIETSYSTLVSESLRFGNGLRTIAGLNYGDTILICR